MAERRTPGTTPNPHPRRSWLDLPWTEYFNEDEWIFKPGEDFPEGDRERFRQHAYHVARYAMPEGTKIRTQALPDGSLLIQALPDAPDPD